MNNEFFDLAKHALDYGLSLGAEEIEIYAVKGFSRTVQLEKSAISRFSETSGSGIGVRIFKNKAVGMSSTTIFTKENIEKTVKNAFSLSKISQPDPKFQSLPSDDRPIPDIKDLYDEAVENLSVEEFTDLMLQSVEEGKIEKDVIIGGNYGLGKLERLILNSQGIERWCKATSISGYLSVKIEKEDDLGVAYYYDSSNTLKQFDYLKIGKEAGIRAKKMLGAKKIETKSLPILLDPESTYGTLGSIIAQGVNAFNVINKTSFFIDKIGDKIATEKLTIIDDPFYPGGTNSTRFDDEGVVPQEKTVLVKDGILQTYVTDSYTAPLVGLENTGHASRGTFSSRPVPSVYALQIQEGEISKDSLLEELKEGIFLLGSSIHPSGDSPTISSQINQGFYVKDGEIVHPVKNAVIGGNIFELLNSITYFSKEIENRKGQIAPWMLIENLKVSGGK
ncbi:MAG: TldD/PmbA family protein [Candidatus Heimdallarchaeaceae archaeon]